MITAAEARDLMPRTLEKKIDDLCESIRAAASQGRTQIRTGWDHKLDGDLWQQGGYDGSADWHRATAILQSLGYITRFVYQDGSIAVDMYTLISWEK